jgi:hypothetical protein
VNTSARPVVSFLIISSAQSAPYLRECLDSIRGQSFIDIEILLLDPTLTEERLPLYEQLLRYGYPFRLIRMKQTLDLMSHYNYGIQQAEGDLIWLIPAEHCLASPHVLQDFVTQFILNPSLGFAFCRAQHMDENSMAYESYTPHKKHSDLPYHPTLYPGLVFFRQLLKGNVVPAPCAIARKQCYQQIGMFENTLAISADWYNWLRFTLEWDVYFDPAPKVFARKPRMMSEPTTERTSTNRQSELEHCLLCYQQLEKHLQNESYPKVLRRQAQLAQLQFMRRKGYKMSLSQKFMRIYRKLTAPTFELTPVTLS